MTPYSGGDELSYILYYSSMIYSVFIDGSCSHVISYHYYAHSIWSRDDYIAYRCPSWDDFEGNRCDNASKNLMGEWVNVNGFVIYPYTFSMSMLKYVVNVYDTIVLFQGIRRLLFKCYCQRLVDTLDKATRTTLFLIIGPFGPFLVL